MLRTYRAKRNFETTAEPRGGSAKRAAPTSSFVIQKHAATRLHYDLRLELDGVMKSWAVTRGPSLVPAEKRLAIHVEDHPIEYNTFEGTIPKGQYGGGTVMIWDRGTWEAEGDAAASYAKGRLTFRLSGERLQGMWHLVRLRKRPGERQEGWLLIKSDDEAARSARDPDILDEMTTSVVSGRSMDEITAGKPAKRAGRKTPVKRKGPQTSPKSASPRQRTARADGKTGKSKAA